MLGGDSTLSKAIIFSVSAWSFIVGIALLSFIPKLQAINKFYYFALFLFFLVIIILRKINKQTKIAMLMAIFLFLGAWRYAVSLDNFSKKSLSIYSGQSVDIQGIISSDITHKSNKQKFFLQIKKLNNYKIDAKILIYTLSYPRLSYGDELFLSCELIAPKPITGFAYDRYLARYGVYFVCYYPLIEKININSGNYFLTQIYRIKNKGRAIINRGLAEPEASLARAIIMGDGKLLDDNLRLDFSRAGISHIVAISGLHIGIIASLMAGLFFWLGFRRWQVFYITIFILIFFIILIGAPASAVRAGIMVGLAMYALQLGRLNNIERLVILTADILLLTNPRLLRDDIGFQLSFVAVLGIIYLFPLVNKILEKFKISNKFRIRDILGVTLAAQISTGPLATYYFGVLPILGIFANIFILWSLPLIIASTALAGLLTLFFNFGERFFFFIPWLLLHYIILITNLIIKLPVAYLELSVSLILTLIYYFLLILLVFVHKKVNKILI